MAIRLCFVAKWSLAIWRQPITKCTLAIWRQPIVKHSLAILETSYCFNRKDRVSSLYWTRGSKLCFLTCFFYFSRYFHILAFLLNCYLLISSRLSQLHGNPISRPVSCTLGTWSWYVVHAPPCFWHRTHEFLKARCSWELGSECMKVTAWRTWAQDCLYQRHIILLQINLMAWVWPQCQSNSWELLYDQS